ncbi:hypothetical protein GCM10008932_19100 [Alkalibacterium iburiense]|uniref:Lipoprotein n=1 Tax=Alkalibacterium iburiense TaxID=290589 RepID=A0ABN0XLN6_9LACT
MKKWVAGLGAALILMGCNGTADEETDDAANNTPDTEENQDTEAGLTIENDEVLSILHELVETSDIDDVGLPDDITIQFTGLYLDDAEQELLLPIFLISNRTEEAYTNIEMSITFGTSDGELLFEETSFMLGENDLILMQLQELINNTAEVGTEGDIVIHWTGIYEYSMTEENGDAIFLIVNRTGENVKNIELGIEFTDANGNVILQDERFYLSEEEFGILADQTIMPLYLEIPEDKEQFMIGLEDVNQAYYAFEYFDAESAE